MMLRPKSIDFPPAWQTNCLPHFKQLFSAESAESAEPVESNKLSAFQLYGNVYELCVSVPENHTQRLLHNINELLNQLTTTIGGSIRGDSLDEYLGAWRRYESASRALNAVCRYLNKCLAVASITSAQSSQLGPNGQRSTNTNNPTVLMACQLAWRKNVLGVIGEGVRESVLVAWNDSEKQDSVSEVVQSFNWCSDDSLVRALQSHLPQAYSALSNAFLATNSVSAYISYAADLLLTESQRLQLLFPIDTASSLLARCEAELITSHSHKLQTEFDGLLREANHQQLGLLYGLLSRQPSTLTSLQSAFKSLITSEGKTAISASGLPGLIRVMGEMDSLREAAFSQSDEMEQARSEALSDLINHHLPSGPKVLSQALLNGQLEALKLLSLLEDFDAFFALFQGSLAERIMALGGDGSLMSNVMEGVCGVQKCSGERAMHLRRMLRDAQEGHFSLDDCNLTVQVITQHSWPREYESAQLQEGGGEFPEHLQSQLEAFRSKYLAEHSGRKLVWCPQLLSVEVEDCQNGQRYLMSLQQYSQLPKIDLSAGERLSDNLISLLPRQAVPSINADAPAETVKPSVSGSSHAHVLQALIVSLLKRRQKLSPAELFKVLRGELAGRLGVVEEEEVRGALDVLQEKGFVEYNRADNLYLYLA